MLWGPGAAQLEADWAILDGVHGVRGVAAGGEWLRQCSSGEISRSPATTIVGILSSHQAMREGRVSTRESRRRTNACGEPSLPRADGLSRRVERGGKTAP